MCTFCGGEKEKRAKFWAVRLERAVRRRGEGGKH